MNSKVFYKMFIWTFIILYVGTAFISYCHSIEFFNIGNVSWMSYILGIIFEIGQATVLASLLLTNNKKMLLPWVLMILLTSVQVIGNVYSVFKFISLSETEYYTYLSSPLLFWLDGVSQETVKIIIAWVVGALLPIIALAMTSMVTNQLKLQKETETISEEKDKVIEDDVKIEKDEIIKDVSKEKTPTKPKKATTKKTKKSKPKTKTVKKVEEKVETIIEKEKVEDVKIEETKKPSHRIKSVDEHRTRYN